MGYFPNGTAGEEYREQYCKRCIHDEGDACSIWELHLLFNGESGEIGEALEILIPTRDTDNLQCSMFVDDEEGIGR